VATPNIDPDAATGGRINRTDQLGSLGRTRCGDDINHRRRALDRRSQRVDAPDLPGCHPAKPFHGTESPTVPRYGVDCPCAGAQQRLLAPLTDSEKQPELLDELGSMRSVGTRINSSRGRADGQPVFGWGDGPRFDRGAECEGRAWRSHML